MGWSTRGSARHAATDAALSSHSTRIGTSFSVCRATRICKKAAKQLPPHTALPCRWLITEETWLATASRMDSRRRRQTSWWREIFCVRHRPGRSVHKATKSFAHQQVGALAGLISCNRGTAGCRRARHRIQRVGCCHQRPHATSGEIQSGINLECKCSTCVRRITFLSKTHCFRADFCFRADDRFASRHRFQNYPSDTFATSGICKKIQSLIT